VGGRWILAGVAAVLASMAWAAPASADVNREFFGLSGWGSTGVTPHDDWQQIGDARIGTWRAPLRWLDVEPNPPRDAPGGCSGENFVDGDGKYHCYRWGTFDSVVGNAARVGIRVLPYAFESPVWETGSGSPPCIKCPPVTAEQLENWRLFLQRAVARYGEGGDFWEGRPALDQSLYVKWIQAWNEPNFNTNWCHAPGDEDRPHGRQCRVSAKEYGQLVKETCNAVKGTDCVGLEPTDPRTKVLLAGLPQTYQSNDTRMIRFLRNVYAKLPKAKRYFQGVAVHPFATGKEGVRGAVLRAKDAMKDNRGVELPRLPGAGLGDRVRLGDQGATGGSVSGGSGVRSAAAGGLQDRLGRAT
jgi:hypothetical protein